MTMSPSSAKTVSKSSDRQVQASENRCRVTVMVSVMPRLSRSSAMSAVDRLRGAAIDHARQQIHRAGRVGRIAHRPGTDREVDGDRRDRARLLRDDDHAIATARRATGSRPVTCEVAVGDRRGLEASSTTSNVGTVSIHMTSTSTRCRSAAARTSRSCGWTASGRRARPSTTSSSVTAAIRGRRVEKAVDARNRFEVSQLVRDVGDAVVVEHEPRFELRLGFRQLRRR